MTAQESKLKYNLEDWVKVLFEKSPIGLNLCTMEGLWIESNQAFLDIIGYNSDEADEKLTYWQLTPRKYDDQETVQIKSLVETGKYGPYEKEFIRKDGSLIPVRLNGFIVKMDGVDYIWSMIEDITQIKKLESSLEEERIKIIQSSKLASIGELASGIAHEINNPLAIIDGYIDIFKEYFVGNHKMTDQEVMQLFEKSHKTVNRVTKIVKSLRKFAREANLGENETVPVSIIVNDTLDLISEKLKAFGVKLEVVIEKDFELFVNSIEVSQVLLNLLTNSFDAVRDGENSLIKVEVKSDSKPDFILITVEDSGDGFKKMNTDKIFEPFFTTKPINEGTGLGLSVSKGIVEGHGGNLYLDETVECTRFVIELPLKGATK